MKGRLEYIFYFFLLAIAGWIMFRVLQPFLAPLFIAIAFAVIFQPLYNRMLLHMNGRRGLASIFSVIVVIIVILIPLTFFGSLLLQEAHQLYIQSVTGNAALGPIQNLSIHIERAIHNIAPQATLDVEGYLNHGLSWMVDHLDAVFAGFLHILISVVVMIISLFYLFKDGPALRMYLIKLSPLTNEHDEKILQTLQGAINTVIRGSITVSLCQGFVAGLGFWIFGIPSPILWGSIAVLAALIPGVGTSLVLIPGVIYLFVTGNTLPAVGLAIWGSIAVGLIDNVLGPYLIRRGTKIHPLLILFSVLGGIAYFGPIGFLAGPIFLSFCFALLEIYPIVVKESRI